MDVADRSLYQTTPEEGRGPSVYAALRSLGILGAASVGVGLFFGRHIYTASADLGWHYALVEFIFQHGSLPSSLVTRLGPMLEYPPGAHVLVAFVSWIFEVNPLRALLLVSVLTVFGFYFLVLVLFEAHNRPDFLIKSSFFIVLMMLLSGTHTLVGNEIIGNFFYAQLVGDLGFILLLLIASKLTRPRTVLMYAIVAVYALAWIYPLSASKLALSVGLLQILTLSHGYSKEGIVVAITMVVLLPVILVTHPTFEPMLRNAAHDGDLSITLPVVLATATVLLTLALCIWWLNFARASGAKYAPLIAAGLSTGILAWVQFGFWHFAGLGSPYAVKKHGFLICTLVTASFAIALAEVAFRSELYQKRQAIVRIPIFVTRLVAACLAVIAVLPRHGVPLAPVIRYDNEVRAIAASGAPPDLLGHTISVNRDLPMPINFAVALAVLHLPGWSPAALDQFAVFGLGDPTVNAVHYAIAVPVVPNLPLGCVVQTYTSNIQLLRRECLQFKLD
jgi:hypothetical protein